MDKASGGPTAGLIIGKEECMVPIRRALGIHGDRWGTVSSHGKAAYVTVDPGKEALVGVIAALKVLRDKPEKVKKPVDDLYKIVKEEFAQIDHKLRNEFTFTKSYNSAVIEVNYEKSWREGGLKIPIFTIEDMYAGSNILQVGLGVMGLIPTVAYDANIMISPGCGTTDKEGNLIEERARWAVKAMVKMIEITCKYAGIL